MRQAVLVFIGFSLSWTALAIEQVHQIRFSEETTKTRFVLDLSGPVDYHVTPLHNPERLLLEIRNAKMSPKVEMPEAPFVHSIRASEPESGTIHLIFETDGPFASKHFNLDPSADKPYRLVMDLYPTSGPIIAPAIQVAQNNDWADTRPFIIAIDPGHGGKDPGAIGQKGTKEKDVALGISKALVKRMNQEENRVAFLTRETDIFIPLADRVKIARQKGADLFISIHADAFSDPKVQGASVYVLSKKASSKTARWLADSENKVDLIGGVSLDDKSKLLRSVLLDLSQTAALSESYEIANHILSQLNRVTSLYKKNVESAGFMVLKAPDMPSVLIETGFISSHSSELRLASRKHQKELAQAINKAINLYLMNRPLPLVQPESQWTRTNRQQYKVNSGDTLSGIVEKYNISLSELKEMNGLEKDTIQVGQILQVPIK